MFFGHTDPRINVSKAKFDAGSDFEVRFSVAPQKLPKIEKNKSNQKLHRFAFVCVENKMLVIV